MSCRLTQQGWLFALLFFHLTLAKEKRQQFVAAASAFSKMPPSLLTALEIERARVSLGVSQTERY